jgi:hypothetical protein
MRLTSPDRPLSSASQRGSGLLSQQIAEAPAGPPSLSGAPPSQQGSAPLYINGHAPPSMRTTGSGFEGAGNRSGARSPDDPPGTRNGSKSASPRALEAQVAKLVQGQQQLSNQLEELALQISLSQSGLGAAPRLLPQSQGQAAAQQQRPAAPGWRRLCGLDAAGVGGLPPLALVAAGALAGGIAATLLMSRAGGAGAAAARPLS